MIGINEIGVVEVAGNAIARTFTILDIQGAIQAITIILTDPLVLVPIQAPLVLALIQALLVLTTTHTTILTDPLLLVPIQVLTALLLRRGMHLRDRVKALPSPTLLEVNLVVGAECGVTTATVKQLRLTLS